MTTSREILLVTPFLPYPPDFGGAIRIFEFIRGLSVDHRVIVLAPVTEAEQEAVRRLGEICDVTAVPARSTLRQPAGWDKRAAQLRSATSRQSFAERSAWNPQMQAVMDRLFMTRHIDLVHYESAQMVRYQPLRPCPTVLDNQNIEHELLERVARSSASLSRKLFNNIEWRKVRRLEHEAWRSVTVNLATSALDAERIRAAVDVPVETVPNGVAVDAYENARNHPRTAGRVVFVAAMRHQPNADGARWYVQHVHPLVLDAVPEATFEIVGADPPENLVQMASTTVRVTGRVESVVPNLAAASVVVVPLHAGGGTRLKILEAFAAGVPVVSTTIGAEGLDVVPNQHLLIADTAHDFANAVVRVLRGVNLPDTFRIKDARQLVEDRYDWKTGVVPALTSAYDRAIEVFDRVEKEQGSGT